MESGHAVCFVVDERSAVVDTAEFDKISLTMAAFRGLNLYCPSDVGWRCGDYGFYFARQRFPQERFFWLMEYDVRLTGPDLGQFFDCFVQADAVDLIAGHYRMAESWWYWTHTMATRDQPVWRCLFPVVRLSAAAVDLLYAERLAYARKPLRLANWPNDESFVATTLARDGRRCADINDFGTQLYDDTSYTFGEPINGDEFDERGQQLKLYHPVLYGEDLRRKLKFMAWINKGESLPRKVKRRVIDALARRSAA